MKKFNPQDLSLLNAILITTPFALLFSVWFWISGKPYDFDGARSLALDNHGVTHVQVDKTLYRYDAAGVELPSINLADLGVVDFVGDLSFNSQNELLVRRGSYDIGFLENLSVFFRASNKRDINAIDGEGLALCNLSSLRCRSFGEAAHDFNRGFFSVANNFDDSFIVSDASRHEVHKFDKAGRRVATLDVDLAFPNDLVIDQGKLYLADTNNKAIKQLALETTAFGSDVAFYPIANPDANRQGHWWPYSFEKVGDFWWIVVVDDEMHHGGVYIFDEAWDYVKALEMSENAAPTAVLYRAGEVLISDVEADKLARYNIDGDYIGDVVHNELNTQLAINTEQRVFYKKLNVAYLSFIGVVFIVVFLFAFRLVRKAGLQELDHQETTEPVLKLNMEREGQLIEWVPTNNKFRSIENVRRLQLIGLVSCFVVMGLLLFYTNTYINPGVGIQSLSTMAPVFILVCGLLLFVGEEVRVRLGTYDDKLVLHDQLTNTAFAANGSAVLYDGQRIAFGDLSTSTGSANQAVYDNVAFTKHVFPVLASAFVVNPTAMEVWRSRNEKKRALETLMKVVFVVLACAVMWCLVSLDFIVALF